jgi:hypothetical protein
MPLILRCGSGVDTPRDIVGGEHGQAIGLIEVGGDLGEKLVQAPPIEHSPVSARTLSLIAWRHRVHTTMLLPMPPRRRRARQAARR